MDLPANRPRVAQKKFGCRFLKCTVRYESHLVTISAKRFQKSPAKCPAFSCHFLLSMLCVPAPCASDVFIVHVILILLYGAAKDAIWGRGWLGEGGWGETSDCATLWCSRMVYKDKNSNSNKNPPFPPTIAAPCACCAVTLPLSQ